MAILVLDQWVEQDILAQRRKCGSDCYDEVWDGVYHITRLPNDDHQRLVTGLSCLLQDVVNLLGAGEVRAGINVSDRDRGWLQNYRIPDIAVILPGGRAVNRDTHWEGGPDFIIEITSPNDESRQKIPFYASIGVREMLLVDRNPWCLELYCLHEGELRLCGDSQVGGANPLASQVLPLEFKLLDGVSKPAIEVRSTEKNLRWEA